MVIVKGIASRQRYLSGSESHIPEASDVTPPKVCLH